MPADERTEAATPRKRSELRKRGQVAKSQDLASMIVFMGVILCLHAVGGAATARLQANMSRQLASLGTEPLTVRVVQARAAENIALIGAVTGPFLLTAIILGVLANMLQTGFLVAPAAMKPDFNRLNPLTGVKRYFSARGVVETAKNLAKLTIIGWIAYSCIAGEYAHILDTMRQDLPTIAAEIGDLLYRLAIRIVGFLLVLAALDYGWQRYSFEKSIRMTKEEVKQEAKQQEGSPQVKARIKARMRQIARKRMMQQVPLADVVVTNPTHFAVALKYDSTKMVAPQVVAKGADVLAAKIRALAEEHAIPIVENPPLARSLYKSVEVGREVPAEFYGAVAEVLAFVYQLNAQRRRADARAYARPMS